MIFKGVGGFYLINSRHCPSSPNLGFSEFFSKGGGGAAGLYQFQNKKNLSFLKKNQAGKGSSWFRQKPNVFQKSDQLRTPNMMLEEEEELVHEVIKEISSLGVHKITKSICLRIVILYI